MGRPKGSTNGAKRKLAKDPNKPKRPTSAYFYFVADKREEHKKAGRKITKVAEWTKEVSAIWREITDEDKEPFAIMAAKDKARYDEEMAAYKGKDPNKPKRGQSAYFLFLADFRAKNKGVYEENKDLLRGAGEEWKNLDDEEKKPYEDQAAIEKKKYEAAMANYKPQAAKKPKVEASNGHTEDEEEDEEDDEEEEEEEDDE